MVHGSIHHKRQVASDCNTLSQQYGVTTGDLQYLTDSDTCTISAAVCLPAKCELQQVVGNLSWYVR